MADILFHKDVWENFRAESLSLGLQSLALCQAPENAQSSWKKILLDILDNEASSKATKFEYLRSLQDSLPQLSVNAAGQEKAFLQVLGRRPDDLNLIIWFLLRPLSTAQTANEDAALPESRLRRILLSMFTIISLKS